MVKEYKYLGLLLNNSSSFVKSIENRDWESVKEGNESYF